MSFLALILLQVVIDFSPGTFHGEWVESTRSQRLHMDIVLLIVISHESGHWAKRVHVWPVGRLWLDLLWGLLEGKRVRVLAQVATDVMA